MPASSTPLYSSLAQDADMSGLVREFVAELQTRVDALRAAFDSNNLTELARLAHQLNGAGGGYGFDLISIAAADLENATRLTDSVEPLRSKLDELIDRCLRATADPPTEPNA